MTFRLNSLKTITIYALAILILIISSSDLEAARKRKKKFKSKKTKQEAIELIRVSSPSVCQIAGLEPINGEEKANVDVDYEEAEDLSVIGLVTEPEPSELGDYGENIEELEETDDVEIDHAIFNSLWLSYVADGEVDEFTEAGLKKTAIMGEIMDWLGTPYRFGASSRSSIDCSAFVQQIYLSSGNILLPRTARTQIEHGEKVPKSNLEFGDLVYFHTYSKRFASHVGIYLGDNLFAHASSRYGVTVSSLESSYYKRTFITGKRLGFKEATNLAIKKEDEISNVIY